MFLTLATKVNGGPALVTKVLFTLFALGRGMVILAVLAHGGSHQIEQSLRFPRPNFGCVHVEVNVALLCGIPNGLPKVRHLFPALFCSFPPQPSSAECLDCDCCPLVQRILEKWVAQASYTRDAARGDHVQTLLHRMTSVTNLLCKVQQEPHLLIPCLSTTPFSTQPPLPQSRCLLQRLRMLDTFVLLCTQGNFGRQHSRRGLHHSCRLCLAVQFKSVKPFFQTQPFLPTSKDTLEHGRRLSFLHVCNNSHNARIVSGTHAVQTLQGSCNHSSERNAIVSFSDAENQEKQATLHPGGTSLYLRSGCTAFDLVLCVLPATPICLFARQPHAKQPLNVDGRVVLLLCQNGLVSQNQLKLSASYKSSPTLLDSGSQATSLLFPGALGGHHEAIQIPRSKVPPRTLKCEGSLRTALDPRSMPLLPKNTLCLKSPGDFLNGFGSILFLLSLPLDEQKSPFSLPPPP